MATETFDLDGFEEKAFDLSTRTIESFARPRREHVFFGFAIDVSFEIGHFKLCFATEAGLAAAHKKKYQDFPEDDFIAAEEWTLIHTDILQRYIDAVAARYADDISAGRQVQQVDLEDWPERERAAVNHKLCTWNWDFEGFNDVADYAPQAGVAARWIDQDLYEQWPPLQDGLRRRRLSLESQDRRDADAWKASMARAASRVLFRLEQSGVLGLVRQEPHFVSYIVDYDVEASASLVRMMIERRAFERSAARG